ncbi:MAG: CYTH domain-containing protein [Magnetococcales bacterium]|nr:CYTH domain-containing protein [Magnetococcales bacterium]
MMRVADGTMEQEVKLTAVDAATLDRIAADVNLLNQNKESSWKTKPLATTYLDTPGRALLAHGYGFRFRVDSSNGLWQACLKGDGAIVDGFCVRREWEQEILAPVDRLSLLPEGPLRQQVLGIAPGEAFLAPLVHTRFERRSLLLHLEGGCVTELALDCGEVRAGDQSLPLFEVELEQKSGPTEPMVQLARTLRQRHRLQPSRHSKFALGLTLLDGRIEPQHVPENH